MHETTTSDDVDIRPFRIAVPNGELDDLYRRLDSVRWPTAETVDDRSQGVRLERVRELVDRWRNGYDWRRTEATLNAHPQFHTTIDGVDLHFLHVRSSHPRALPVILTHGWPGSFADFTELIEPLVDPVSSGGRAEDAFDVVVPSLPGFGFSGKPTTPGWTVERIAAAWATLMRRLGYREWVAHGGDWGAAVTTALGASRPEGLLGVHLSTPYAFPAQIPTDLDASERRAVDGLALYAGALGGANHVQGTVPQTLGYGLADSPVGQAAWIWDKYESKTDNAGRAQDAIDVDRMIDTIAISWFTNSAASSARIYWDNRSATMSGPHLHLPVAVTVFPKDVPLLPRSWIEDAYSDLVHFGEAPRGGHFAALEQPEFLASEIRSGLRGLRT
ncbi:epoxide hydrolase family protein [Plantibacter sp. Leaf314]|uniref:epoxide hydrolase family protein n=1 Tax=Plantibacter sp. Leaf314 TaxID=1736333 RepID=UPI00070196C5|nr:epoxide hydrolase family protein [Plantibacter sp. Leaf314]KQQ51356.1 epoxide hydrolase [Plantibacter sp. Leaf314]